MKQRPECLDGWETSYLPDVSRSEVLAYIRSIEEYNQELRETCMALLEQWFWANHGTTEGTRRAQRILEKSAEAIGDASVSSDEVGR